NASSATTTTRETSFKARIRALRPPNAETNPTMILIKANAAYGSYIKPGNTLYTTNSFGGQLAVLKCNHPVMNFYLVVDVQGTIAKAGTLLYKVLYSHAEGGSPVVTDMPPWIHLRIGQGKTHLLRWEDHLALVCTYLPQATM
ncbi:MAG: hypothetical protein Q9204_000930, partial [Flavoplaca sp. TL-2023a]